MKSTITKILTSFAAIGGKMLMISLMVMLIIASMTGKAQTWSSTGSMTTVRFDHRATLMPNGMVLVTGGGGNYGDLLSSCELYDPTGGTWSSTGSMTAARKGHTATLLPNGMVLVTGGGSNGTLNSCELYDQTLGSWSTTGSMSTGRYYHTATLLSNGMVLVTGGSDINDYPISSCELYNPVAGTWISTDSMAIARVNQTATLLPNGKVLVIGGNGVTNNLRSCELYDPTTGMWTSTGSMSTTREYPVATLISNANVLVAGGHANISSSSCELYDIATGTWTSTGAMARDREFQTATLLSNGKVLVSGGFNGSSDYLASCELYDTTIGTWAYTASMASARFRHTATLLSNNNVLVTGGLDADYLSSCELFIPPCTSPDVPTLNASVNPTCSGSPTTLNITSGTLNSATTWQWYTGSCGGTNIGSGASISVSPTTTTTYYVRGEEGCVIPGSCGSITITINPLPIPVISGSPFTACYGNTVTLDAGISDANGSYTNYSWNNSGGTNETVEVTPLGTLTYTVTITNTNNCTNTASQSVTLNSLPIASITGTTTGCGSISLTASGGGTYEWSGGNSPTSAINTFTNSGTYTATVTGINTCTATATANVTVNIIPTAIFKPFFPQNHPLCVNQAIDPNIDPLYMVVDETSASGTMSVYKNTVNSNSGGTLISSEGVPDTSYIFSLLPRDSIAGTFYFYAVITNSDGCSVTSNVSGALIVNALPTPSITGTSNVCSGNTVTLNAGSYSSYSWTGGGTGSSQAITATGAYSYTVTVTDGNGCLSATSTSGTIYSLPTPSITGSANVCSGNTVTLNAGPYSSYSWTGGGTGSTQSITATGAYTYTVTVTDGNGCLSATSASGTIFALPTPTITGATNVCSGNTVTLNAGSYSSYSWTGGGTGSSQAITATGAYSYTVTVTDGNGCLSATSASGTIYSLPTPTISGSPFTVCYGNTVTLDAGTSDANGSYTHYTWNNSGGTNETVALTAVGTLTYIVTITNTNNCTNTASQSVIINPNPTANASVTTPVICNGGNGVITVSATGGNLPYTGAGTNTVAQGIYSYTVTDHNGCTSTTSQAITQPAPINFTTVKNNVSGCGPLGSIAVTASGGTGTKTFSDNGGTSYQGATLFSTLANGTYTVKVKDANSCLSSASNVVITTNTGVSFTTSVVNATTCTAPNGKITVSASGGSGFYNYSDNAGTSYQSSAIFTSLLPGTYSMKVKDATGCLSNVATATVGPNCQTRIMNYSDPSNSNTFNIYPNPASDEVTIFFASNKEEGYKIRLIDVTGRIILSQSYTSVVGDNQYQIDLSSVAKGVYTVILQNGSALFQRKIVEQ